jgi:hypothetical protein
MFDLDAYLARIGVSRRPSLREVHTAHATSIPFEGFDAHMGIAPPLGSTSKLFLVPIFARSVGFGRRLPTLRSRG